MTDDENKKRTDLFNDAAAKPLFGDDDAVPAGKPLFDNDFSDPGDAAFVKPLFGGEEEEDENLSLDDFQEFDNIPDSEENDINREYEPETVEASAEIFDSAEALVESPVQEEDPVEETAPADAVADSNIFTAPAVQEAPPPFSDDMFGVEETTLPEPAFTIPAEKVALPGDLEAMSLGALMAYARETVGFTPENVYDGTKINEKFLFAIENDQFDKLPSGAFPGAYVRALCSFYHLENEACEIAQKKAAAYCTACRPPDEVYNQLPEHAVINKEEQEKFRRFITVSGIVIAAVIIIVAALVIFSAVRKDDRNSTVVSPVKMEELEQLDPAPSQVITTELDVPR